MNKEPIVITGIGMITSLGRDRESVWNRICSGSNGIKKVRDNQSGIPDWLDVAAYVDSEAINLPSKLKVIQLAHQAAEEAISDAQIDFTDIDTERFGCAVSGHMGDWQWLREAHGFATEKDSGDGQKTWNQFLPNSGCWDIATRFGLLGPRICHSTACASGLIDIMSAVRAIRDNQADIALAGSGEAIDPLFAAGFKKMRVLAETEDPNSACLPFSRNRRGFVMGEGAAMFVIERLSHALARGATIYAEIVSSRTLADAHHVTGLDMESESLTRLISETIRSGEMTPEDIGYINAHGTGTIQNDLMETRGIRKAFGRHADSICVSSLKSTLGHLVNASGSVELALSTLALRDGFLPPTLNLHDHDPECNLDYVPIKGRSSRVQSAMKLSLAFGGHLVAMAIRRWNDAESGFSYPQVEKRAA